MAGFQARLANSPLPPPYPLPLENQNKSTLCNVWPKPYLTPVYFP